MMNTSIENEDQGSSVRWLLLTILFLAYVCSAVDRAIISLLVEPIKADLHLSDSQISYLQGFAFLLVYSLAGLPAGMLIDRLPRMRLVAMAIVVWSCMTGLCGLARSFGMLFLARAGVGIGEAALSPAALSLITDAFPKRRHGLAIGLYTCGGAAGASIALGFGGLLYAMFERSGPLHLPFVGSLAAWHLTFLLLGIPGLVLAGLFMLMPEPARAPQQGAEGAAGFLRDHRQVIVRHHIATGLSNIVTTAIGAWAASFLIRTYHVEVGTVGVAIGAAHLLGGLGGLLGGGMLSDYLVRYGGQMRLWVCAGGALLGAICTATLPLVHDLEISIALLGLIIFFGGMPFSVANAALQEITPSRSRGTISAIYFLSISVIGSLGPSSVAWITDGFFADETKLGLSLALTVGLAFLLSLVFYVSAIGPYKKALFAMDGKRNS